MPYRSGARSWLRRGAIVLVVIGAGAAAWSILSKHVLHLAELRQFYAVRPGMSEAEVLAIMDRPPGMYGPAGARYGQMMWLG